jgi:hypothetical protein
LFNLCIAAGFIEEFTSAFFVLTIHCNNLMTLSLFLNHKQQVYLLQHFLGFLPDLIIIAVMSGWASPTLQQLLGTASVSLSSIGHHQVGLLTSAGGRRKVPDSRVATEERLFDIKICV